MFDHLNSKALHGRLSLAARFAVLASLAVPAVGFAQDTGTCEKGTASRVLDPNLVEATMFNVGTLFFGNGQEAQYIVPKGSGMSPLYSTGLLVAGKVDDDLRTAVSSYLRTDFWPGPLGEDALPVNPSDCSGYDELYGVTRDDLQEFADTGIPSADLLAWPAHLGAPVLDGDGIAGNYDLHAGDQPLLLGDEMIWWTMNDAGNVHESAETAPIGLEVAASAFAFDTPSVHTNLDPILAYTTFYRYQLIYRGESTFRDAYVGLFADPDLGWAGDDYMGTDTTRNLVYVYNADPVDETYGIPPAVGVTVLDGPVEADGNRELTASSWFSIGGAPQATEELSPGEGTYNSLRGVYFNGTPIREGGRGFDPEGRVTPYMYPGNPITASFWSENNIDGSGTANSPGDRKVILASGPFDLARGDTATFDFAIVFGQGLDRIDSIREMKHAAATVAGYKDLLYAADTTIPILPRDRSTKTVIRGDIYPSPASSQVTIDLNRTYWGDLVVELHDVLGRKIDTRFLGAPGGAQTVYTMSISDLPSGSYFARIKLISEPNMTAPPIWVPIVVAR